MSEKEISDPSYHSRPDEPSTFKGPRAQSCVLCQRKKVKCDRSSPCSTCVRARVQCVPAASLPFRRRKRRFPEAELLARLRHYEELLKNCGVNIDAVSGDVRGVELSAEKVRSDDSEEATLSGLDTAGNRVKQSPATESVRHMVADKEPAGEVGNTPWTGQSNEFRDTEEMLQGSSEDEIAAEPITSSYDTMFASDGDWLLFGSQTRIQDLTALHPQPAQMFRLWQIYLDNVNPLMKIFHAPTVQQQILEASGDLKNVTNAMEALMFGIYSFAVTSMDNADCERVFGETQENLLSRYQSGAQQALLNAGFLKSQDLVVLQALVLYLLSVRRKVDPRALFCLTGIAVRIGQRMGLHRDITGHGLRAFDVEMRRRLWWQIVLLESRVAEFSGAGTSMVTNLWNTKLPLNVNDSDLYPDMRESPIEHTGISEMVFCLIRCEVAEFLRKMRSTNGLDSGWYELSSPIIPLSDKDRAIDQLEDLLERKYLKYCDPSIPLHFISANMARSTLCKMKLIAHHPRLLPDRGAHTAQAEKDMLFSQSLKVLEYHNLVQSSKITQRFLWYVYMNLPMDAHIYILSELRYRTTDDLATRAWEQIAEATENGDFPRSSDHKRRNSPLHKAFANLTIKGWEAREAALQRNRPPAPQPEFILRLRQDLASKNLRTSRTHGNASLSSATKEAFAENPFNGLPQAFQQDQTTLNGVFDPSLMPGTFSMDNNIDWGYWNDLMQD